MSMQDNNGAESFLDSTGRIRPGWRTVLASITSLAFGPSVLLLMCFGIFAPALHGEFGWSIGAISGGAMVISLVVAVISPIQGRMVDRMGSRRLVLFSLPLFGLGFASLSLLGSDIRIFYLACIVLTLLAFGTWPLSFMQMVSTWFDRRLGLALGAANVGPGLGAAIVPVIIGVVMASYDWRAAYAILGGLVIIVSLPVAIAWLRENPDVRAIRAGAHPVATPAGLELREILRDRPFWLLVLAFTGLGFFSSGILIHQVNILMDHGMSRNQAIGAQSVLGIASIFGRLAGGWLLDRVHVSRFMFVLMALGAGACWIYATPTSGPLLIVAAATCGMIIGAEFDACGYAIRRYHGLKNFGTVYGLIFVTFQLGGAAGSIAVGAARDATGSFAVGLTAIGALGLLSGLIFLALGRYRFLPHGAAVPDAPETSNKRQLRA